MIPALLVNQEIIIEANPARVWEAIASETGMKKWLGPREYTAQVGGKINFLVKLPDHEEFMFGEVVTFDPPHVLAFTWQQQVLGGATWPVATLVDHHAHAAREQHPYPPCPQRFRSAAPGHRSHGTRGICRRLGNAACP